MDKIPCMETNMPHYLLLPGASGPAAAERPRGQLQWRAVISSGAALLQPTWLPVSANLLFILIRHVSLSLRSYTLFLAVASRSSLLLYPTRLFQMGGDLEDLESALNKSSQTRPLGSGSCSALIKLLPNNKELLVSHDTWNTYQAMLRIMKKYNFAFKVSPLGNLLM